MRSKDKLIKDFTHFLSTIGGQFKCVNNPKLHLWYYGQVVETELIGVELNKTPCRYDDTIFVQTKRIGAENIDVDSLTHFNINECEAIFNTIRNQHYHHEHRKITHHLRNANLPYEQIECKLPYVAVSISCGHWKDTHIRLDNLMQEIGFHFDSEDEVNEEHNNDANIYSSVHYYIRQ